MVSNGIQYTPLPLTRAVTVCQFSRLFPGIDVFAELVGVVGKLGEVFDELLFKAGFGLGIHSSKRWRALLSVSARPSVTLMSISCLTGPSTRSRISRLIRKPATPSTQERVLAAYIHRSTKLGSLAHCSSCFCSKDL